jgi:hypothetical protein
MVEGAGDEVHLSHSNNRLLKVGGTASNVLLFGPPI